MLTGHNLAFIIISVFVIGTLIHFLKDIQKKDKLSQICMGAILGGASGNLIDRLIYGSVTDFIDFQIWPIFNIADSAITLGVVILVIHLWKK